MISNSVKIGNVAVETKGSIVAEKNRKGAVGYGSLTVFSERAERYEPFTVVDLVCGLNNPLYPGIQQKTFQYVVQADEPHLEKTTFYEHQITLADTILYFKTIFPADRSFTRETPMTIKEIFDVYARELLFYQGITITLQSDTDAIYATKMPWKEYASKSFAVIIFDLFRRIDCIPRVTWAWATSTWTFSSEPINAKGALVTVTANGADTAANDMDYATDIKGQARNALRENDPGIWFPSVDGWISSRAKGTLFRDTELQFQLPHPIITLKKAVAYVNCTMLLQGASVFTEHVVEVDFTGSVLTKEEWETLPVYSLPNCKTRVTYAYLTDTYTYQAVTKQNTLYYEIEGKTIDNLFSQQQYLFFTENVVSLNHAIFYWIIKSANEQYDLYWDNPDHYTEVVAPAGYGDNMDDADTELLKCRFLYATERDFDFKTEKSDITGLNKTTVLNAQSENMIDAARYLESSQALANRLGHAIQRREQLFTEFQEPWDLGDYHATLGTIIDIRYAFDRYNTLVTADFAIGFSNTSAEYSVSKEPEAFLIGRVRQRTNPIYSEYLVFSAAYIPNDTIFSTDAWLSAINILAKNHTNLKAIHHCNLIPVPTDTSIFTGTEAIDFEVFGTGSGNVIMMNITADHQTIAGYGKIKIDTAWYKNPVKYVDSDNELTDIDIVFNDTTGLKADTSTQEFYPMVQKTSRIGAMTAGAVFPIDKNPNDNFGFTLQLICVSTMEDVIVGNGFAKYNNLIFDNTIPANVHMYVSTTPFSLFDKIVRPDDILDSGAGYGFSITYPNVKKLLVDLSSAYEGYNWAITYGTEIMLAGNNETYEIYTSIEKERPRE